MDQFAWLHASLELCAGARMPAGTAPGPLHRVRQSNAGRSHPATLGRGHASAGLDFAQLGGQHVARGAFEPASAPLPGVSRLSRPVAGPNRRGHPGRRPGWPHHLPQPRRRNAARLRARGSAGKPGGADFAVERRWEAGRGDAGPVGRQRRLVGRTGDPPRLWRAAPCRVVGLRPPRPNWRSRRNGGLRSRCHRPSRAGGAVPPGPEAGEHRPAGGRSGTRLQ